MDPTEGSPPGVAEGGLLLHTIPLSAIETVTQKTSFLAGNPLLVIQRRARVVEGEGMGIEGHGCVFMPASSFVEACSIACASSMRMLSPGSSPNSCHSAEDAVTWELPPLMHAHVGRPAGTQATYEDHGELEPNPNKPDMPTVLTFGGITDALLASFKQCISDLATSS
eukprot:scaffold187545_cov22-Tisochrysis_lutea.AAC.1